MSEEIVFNKYKIRGSMHWQEMMSRDPRKFNAYQQARYGWILKMAGEIRGRRVLDLGCGDGSLTYLLAKNGAQVVGVDNEEEGLRFAEENLKSVWDSSLKYKFVSASAYTLPFEEGAFDFVVSCEVIEHLQQPEKMLQEGARVLKTGGLFVLTTPYKVTEVPQDPNHVNEYYPSQIKEMLGRYFKTGEVKLTHHALWSSIYTYAVRTFGNRPLGRWLINIPVLLFGWNPFMADLKKATKFDRYTTILGFGTK